MPLVSSPLTPSVVNQNLPEDLGGGSYTLQNPTGMSDYAAGANGFSTPQQAEEIWTVVTQLLPVVDQMAAILEVETTALTNRRVLTGITVEKGS
jgi:hypothetical protein